MINSNTLDIMTECASIDTANINHTLEQDFTSEISNFFAECAEMSIEFQYRPEDVAVQVEQTVTGEENYIEYDALVKLADYKDCTLKEAMIMVCEVEENKQGGMTPNNTYLVFDEKTSVINSLKKKGKEEKEKIKKTIDNIKSQGLKPATKKGSAEKKCAKCGKKKCEC